MEGGVGRADRLSGEAPLLSVASAGPPEGGSATWTQSADGTWIRIGWWPGGARGTMVVFTGRTEFIEKYYDPVAKLRALGFCVAVIDWRGQGLSDRSLPDRRKGHVNDFAEFQLDVDAYRQTLQRLGAPEPWVSVAHSMGGAICVRALMRQDAGELRGPRFQASLFSAPMLGLYGSGVLDVAQRLLSKVMAGVGRESVYAAGCDRRTGAEHGVEDNYLTNDPERFQVYADFVTTHDDLALGGPTWGWLAAANREIARLQPSVTPGFMVLGAKDRVVKNADCVAFAKRAPDIEALMLVEARHEPLIETDEIQAQFWPKIEAFLSEKLG